MKTTQNYGVSAELYCAETEDSYIILEMNTFQYYGLEGVAARVWELIREGCQTSDIVQAISAKYGAEVSTVERDIAELLSELNKIGLIVPKTE